MDTQVALYQSVDPKPVQHMSSATTGSHNNALVNSIKSSINKNTLFILKNTRMIVRMLDRAEVL